MTISLNVTDLSDVNYMNKNCIRCKLNISISQIGYNWFPLHKNKNVLIGMNKVYTIMEDIYFTKCWITLNEFDILYKL